MVIRFSSSISSNTIFPPTLAISLLSKPCDRSMVIAVSVSVVYFNPLSLGGSAKRGVKIVSSFEPHVDHSTWPNGDDNNYGDDDDDDDFKDST